MKDLEAVYDEKINPLMAQILAVCKEHNMPMFATFQFADDNLCTSYILPEGCLDVLREARRLVYKPAVALGVILKDGGNR